MSADPMTMMMITTAISAGSSIMGANASAQSAKAESAAAEREALQLEREGKAEYASGTREASAEAKAARKAYSDTIAQQGASGGVTTDAGAVNQLAETETAGQYNVLAALYDAKLRQSGMNDQANARRYSGQMAADRYNAEAVSGIAGAMKTALDGYGQYTSTKKQKIPGKTVPVSGSGERYRGYA